MFYVFNDFLVLNACQYIQCLLVSETHEVQDTETLLQVMRWTLGPRPKMIWDRFKLEHDNTWGRFLRLMESKYSSVITHARISSSISSVSLAKELSSKVCGDISTRNSRAVTRTVNKVVKKIRISESLSEHALL